MLHFDISLKLLVLVVGVKKEGFCSLVMSELSEGIFQKIFHD
jgi:hypothetical protein